MSRDARRLKRLLTLIPAMRRRKGERVDVLAEEFGMSPTELLKELESVVLMVGTPPYTPADYLDAWVEGDRIHLEMGDHFRAPARLTLAEALSARLALEGMAALSQGPFANASASLKRKLSQALGREPEGDVGAAPAGRRVARILTLLDRAVRERRKVSMLYYSESRDAEGRRVMSPYGLVDHGGVWYAIGHDSTQGRELPFRADRIREAEILGERFELPAGFRLEKYRLPRMYLPQGKEIRVVLRFSPMAALRAREFLPEGDLKPERGGGLLYTFLTPSPDWAARWVLEWGGDAEVVGPASVRNAVRGLCRALLKPAGTPSRPPPHAFRGIPPPSP